MTVDLNDLELFADGPPWQTFDELRTSDPVHWSQPATDRGFWSITRHLDIVAVARDEVVFSSQVGGNHEDVLSTTAEN